MSWSGTMFEYLRPLLLLRSLPETLLDQPYRGAVRRQMAYAAGHAVPWGISESAYNVRDRFGTYQYRAFGVPDLALKRGLDAPARARAAPPSGRAPDAGRRPPAGRGDPRLPHAPRALCQNAPGPGADRAPAGAGRHRQPARAR